MFCIILFVFWVKWVLYLIVQRYEGCLQTIIKWVSLFLVRKRGGKVIHLTDERNLHVFYLKFFLYNFSFPLSVKYMKFKILLFYL